MVLADTFGFGELQAEAAWKEGISLQPLDKRGQENLFADSAVIQMNVWFIVSFFHSFFFKPPFAWGTLFSLFGTR